MAKATSGTLAPLTIALSFESSDATQCCTAGVCIEAKAAAGEEHVLGLFLVEGSMLRRDDFVDPLDGGFQEKAWASFLDEQRRRGREVQTFQRQNNRSFLRHLHAIINANTRGTQLDPIAHAPRCARPSPSTSGRSRA